MKYVRILCAVALVFALCSAFTMKDKEKAVYAFGVAASFNDSIVYYTDIQVLDSESWIRMDSCPSVIYTLTSSRIIWSII